MINYLKNQNIPFAVIQGEFDKEVDQKLSILGDLDIVLNQPNFLSLTTPDYLKKINKSTFKNQKTKKNIDLYFQFLNVGYYRYLRISNDSFKRETVSEQEYLIYLIIDPILKFSKYHHRHRLKINKYINNGSIQNIRPNLNRILGKRLTKKLINRFILENYNIESSFVRRCKFRLLFINGNFARMLQVRIFRNAKIL